jgi:predicted nucleic acid-binding protein
MASKSTSADFDALMRATLNRVGCTVLFSEDFSHGQRFGGLTIQNPFRLSPSELDPVLA